MGPMGSKRLFSLPRVGSTLALVALLLGIAGYAAIGSISDQHRSFGVVTHTYTLKETMTALLSDVRALRSAQRNYVQSGGIEHLLEFERRRESLASNLTTLWSTPVPADQRERIERLTSTLADRHAEYRLLLNLAADGDTAGTFELMSRLRGVGQTQMLSRLTDEITAAADETLGTSIDAANTANADAKLLILAGLALSVLVIALSATYLFRDLERRNEVERTLRISSGLLRGALSFQRALIDSAAYAIIATDGNGRITEFNRRAETLLGYPAASVVDQVTLDRFYDPEELTNRAREIAIRSGIAYAPGLETLIALPARGEVEEREWTYIAADGRRVPVHVSMTAICGADARISGYLLIIRDITELRKVDRLKSEFVSTVSHELRTPLTSIRGSLGLVLGTLSSGLSTQVKGLLQIAQNNADRLGRLINDILDVEKIQSGKMEFKLQRQPIRPLLEQAIDSTKEFARQFNVTYELIDKAVGAEIHVDTDRFIQVIVNLLSNAAKFSPAQDTVSITAERHGRTVRISVDDHGKGISDEFHSRIFEKFAQADSSDSRQKSGTGLGLSIAKAIVEKMNGLIGFESRAGHGTTFFVDFPEMTAIPVAPQDAQRTAWRNSA